jgi:hypothetical protein
MGKQWFSAPSPVKQTIAGFAVGFLMQTLPIGVLAKIIGWIACWLYLGYIAYVALRRMRQAGRLVLTGCVFAVGFFVTIWATNETVREASQTAIHNVQEVFFGASVAPQGTLQTKVIYGAPRPTP